MTRSLSYACLLLTLLGAGCRAGTVTLPTRAVADATLSATTTREQSGVPPTWTPPAGAGDASPTAGPTFTPRLTRTPLILPTATVTLPSSPTATPTPLATATPTLIPTQAVAVTSGNLLPNGSFEGGWYHPGGVDELQIPNGWTFQYDQGQNSLDPDPWNRWVRPEVRVLSSDFLPVDEHDLFIWNGKQTLKVFKREGAISVRLLTDVHLPPGTYRFRIHIFPDLVDEYTAAGGKVWAPDPLSGEVRFIIGDDETPWILPTFGRKNSFSHVFSLVEERTLRLGVAIRGRWAIENNGWFMDDWELHRGQ